MTAAASPAVPTVRGDAAWAPRLAARLIDALVVFFLLFALVTANVLWFVAPAADRWHPRPWGSSFVPQVVFVALFAIYDVVFTRLQGQTPGKLVTNVRAVDRIGGEPPSWTQAIRRWALPGLLMLVPGVAFAALAVLATGVPALLRPGRAVHDLMAGTRVEHYDAEREQGPVTVGRRRGSATRMWSRDRAGTASAGWTWRDRRPAAERDEVLSGSARRRRG